jgi:AcrR family transcriptional regulator
MKHAITHPHPQEESATLSRRDRRKLEVKERLFEAAMALLCERSFDEVTVEMITEAADVGKGTFFNHFDNKEGVVAYYFETNCRLLTEQLTRFQEQTPRIPEETTETNALGGPIWRQFAIAGHQVAARDGRNRRLARTLLALAVTNEKVREASLRVKQQVHAIAVELVRLGQKTGEFRDDLPPEFLAEFMRGVYFSALYAWAQSDSEESLEENMMLRATLGWYAIRRQDGSIIPLPELGTECAFRRGTHTTQADTE